MTPAPGSVEEALEWVEHDIKDNDGGISSLREKILAAEVRRLCQEVEGLRSELARAMKVIEAYKSRKAHDAFDCPHTSEDRCECAIIERILWDRVVNTEKEADTALSHTPPQGEEK